MSKNAKIEDFFATSTSLIISEKTLSFHMHDYCWYFYRYLHQRAFPGKKMAWQKVLEKKNSCKKPKYSPTFLVGPEGPHCFSQMLLPSVGARKKLPVGWQFFEFYLKLKKHQPNWADSLGPVIKYGQFQNVEGQNYLEKVWN